MYDICSTFIGQSFSKFHCPQFTQTAGRDNPPASLGKRAAKARAIPKIRLKTNPCKPDVGEIAAPENRKNPSLVKKGTLANDFFEKCTQSDDRITALTGGRLKKCFFRSGAIYRSRSAHLRVGNSRCSVTH